MDSEVIVTLITVFGGTMTTVIVTFLKQRSDSRRYNADHCEREQRIEETLGDVQTSIHELCGRHADLQKSNVAIIRDRINQAHLYHMKEGEIDQSSLDCIVSLYDEYHKMHKNGVVLMKVDELKQLKRKEV